MTCEHHTVLITHIFRVGVQDVIWGGGDQISFCYVHCFVISHQKPKKLIKQQ
jgi:hypothetical protein